MSSNPFLSQWLSAANAASGSWRGFWTAEMARQQTALVTEWQRQALQFWTGAWAKAALAPTPSPAPIAESAVPAAPPALPAPSAPPSTEAAAEPKPLRNAKRPVQLRTAVERRKAAKPAPKRGRTPVTRH